MTVRTFQVDSKEYEQMVALRLKVLLEPIGVPASYINREKEQQDILIGAFENDEIIGCCVLTSIDEETVQLRQMAVLTEVQGTGVGATILQFAEDTAKAKGYKVLMMHARDAVLEFYEKCGYDIAGDLFFEVGIPHHKMEKHLT
jgi:predicted GNAT family N-acyltransferase